MTKKLSPGMMQHLANAMKPEKYVQGQYIITYGTIGTHYYILSKGRVQVVLYQPNTDAKDPDLASKITIRKELPTGAGFGELALIYNDKRSASIVALEDCEVYTLDGMIFKKLIIESNVAKRGIHASFLNSIRLTDPTVRTSVN